MTDTTYATLEEIKPAISIKASELQYDDLLQFWLNAAAKAVDNYCNRPDGFVADSTASARLYVGSGDRYQSTDEFVAITKVEVLDSPTDTTYVTWAASDYTAIRGGMAHPDFQPLSKGYPYNGLLIAVNGDYSTWTSGIFRNPANRVPTVRLTAKWGFATEVPDTIKAATIMQAARWYKRAKSSMSDVMVNQELGRIMFQGITGFILDTDIRSILEYGRYVIPSVINV